MLPPGRLILDTSPSVCGSAPVTKIIGMLAVPAFAARAEGKLPATIAATGRPTSSTASFGSRSSWPSPQRDSITTRNNSLDEISSSHVTTPQERRQFSSNVADLDEAVRDGRCPLWVKSGHVRCNRPCPLYPQ